MSFLTNALTLIGVLFWCLAFYHWWVETYSSQLDILILVILGVIFYTPAFFLTKILKKNELKEEQQLKKKIKQTSNSSKPNQTNNEIAKGVAEMTSLEDFLDEFMEENQENFYPFEDLVRETHLAKWTSRASEIGLGFGFHAEDENTIYVSINMSLEDFDTGEPISYEDIKILNPEEAEEEVLMDLFFERMEDAISEEFYNIAENGWKSLEFPKEIADAILMTDDAKYEYYGTRIYWNDEQYKFGQ